MDNELIKALSSLLDDKLSPINSEIKNIKNDINNMKDDIKDLKTNMNSMNADIKDLKTDMSSMNADIKNMKDDIKSLKTQQEESLSILRSLEHKADVNKSEHDRLFNDIANLSGAVENMRKDLCAVEVVTARNMENIAQLKIVK